MPNINSQNQQNSSTLDTRLLMTVFNSTSVKIAPSVSTLSSGMSKYTYLTLDAVSKFPRDGQENYNPGFTYVDFQAGTIEGSYRQYSSFSKIIPAAGQSIACAVHLDLNDRLYFVYGVPGTLAQVQAAARNFKTDGSAGSLILDNYKSLIWIVILSSSNGTTLTTLTGASLVDCRPFFGENKPSSKKSVHENDVTKLVVKESLVSDVAVGATTAFTFLSSTIKAGDQVTMRCQANISSTLQGSLVDLGSGQYSLVPLSSPAGSKAIARSNGNDWVLNTDYAYGNNLSTVPAVGNKLYGSIDGLTLYHEGLDILSLNPSLTVNAQNLSGYTTYVPANREVAFDPEISILKFGTDFNCGDGRDGSIVLASGTNNLNASIGGITYCRVAKVNALVTVGGKVINYAGSNLNVNPGDFVLIYTAQSISTHSAGNYDLMKVVTASANTINVRDNISAGGVGTTAQYDGTVDSVYVMTVPQFSNLTLQTGATLTCNAFTSAAGGGIVPICVSGTLTFQGTGAVNVDGKGFRGATSPGARGEGYLVGSFNVVGTTALDSGGAGGSPGADGVDGGNTTTSTIGSYTAVGGSGGGSGGDGGGAGGGGGYAATGGTGGRGGAAGAGGGGGGGTSITSTGSAGTAGDGGQGNNAVAGTSGNAGGAGGTATGTGLAVPGTVGAAQPTNAPSGGAAGLSAGDAPITRAYFGGGGGAAASGGKGGASAGNAGGAASVTPGSGGAGGKGTAASTPGGGVTIAGSATGGNGGGIFLFWANSVVNLQASANGTVGGNGGIGGVGGVGSSGAVTGVDTTAASGTGGRGAGGGGGSGGGGGGGAGGTIRGTCRIATIGSVSATAGNGGLAGATAGAGGTGGVGAINSFATAGGGGAGGTGTVGLAGGAGAAGRVRLDYYAINSVFYPTAGSGAGGLTSSSPAGYAGATNRFDTNNVITASFNYIDPNTSFNSQSESLTVQSVSQTSFGSTFPIQVKQLTFTTPTKKAYPVLKGARLERGRSLINVTETINSLGDRIIFDSGLIAATAGTKFTGLQHGLSLAPGQFTPLVFIYQSSFTNLENVPVYVNSPFTNGSIVIGVFIDIHPTTFDYTVGTTGLYMFVDTPSPTPLTSGFIRILFVTN